MNRINCLIGNIARDNLARYQKKHNIKTIDETLNTILEQLKEEDWKENEIIKRSKSSHNTY